jgi:hypothetical protein
MGIFDTSSSSPEFQALVTRWDSYLKKLEARYYEVLQAAEEPLNDIINNIQYDDVVMYNLSQGLKNQTVDQLGKKAEEGWFKMRAEMEKIGAGWKEISAQNEKMGAFKIFLEIEFDKYSVKLFARSARKILENVQNHVNMNKLHRCTQCGAELPIKIYSFISVNIKCESCGSVNTYQPDDRIRGLEWYVINHLAEEQAFDLKLKGRSNKEFAKEYYRKYYGFLMENVPDKKEFYERDMNERLGWVDTRPAPYF